MLTQNYIRPLMLARNEAST